jgi:hypothetical protein
MNDVAARADAAETDVGRELYYRAEHREFACGGALLEGDAEVVV